MKHAWFPLAVEMDGQAIKVLQTHRSARGARQVQSTDGGITFTFATAGRLSVVNVVRVTKGTWQSKAIKWQSVSLSLSAALSRYCHSVLSWCKNIALSILHNHLARRAENQMAVKMATDSQPIVRNMRVSKIARDLGRFQPLLNASTYTKYRRGKNDTII